MSTGYDSDYDWTRGEPTDATPDLVLPGGVADGKSVDQVEQENQFKQMPIGVHVMWIDKVVIPRDESGKPKETPLPVYVNGVQHNVHCYPLELHLKSTTAPPDVTIKLFLSPPPRDPQELPHYIHGTTKNGKSAGWFWNQYKHFLGRLGLPVNADGSLPAETSNPRNWRAWGDGKPRYFVCEVIEGQPNPEKPGQKPFNRLKLFSFAESEDTRRRFETGNTAWHAGGPPVTRVTEPSLIPAAAPAKNPAPAAAPVPAAVGAGADALASGEFDI